MAFEIVDGMTGTKHISSDDLAALNTATVGKADCVLEYGDDFKLTMASANSATLGTGVGMVGGKRFWNQAAVSLTVQSGTQNQKRNDLVVARYAKTSEGIESITPVVIKGTPAADAAADPEVTANDLKLWRIPLDGINAGAPVKLFETVAPLASLGDSVSHEWPVGRAVWLAEKVTPESLGLPGTWKSFRWSLTTKIGSVLDIKDGSYDEGTPVQIYHYNNSEAQKWHVYAEGPGQVTLWIRTA
ncbi:RICIN domain-containing protein [Ellagibacter isourolithinifaciens]|uniref:RICIN domain-containing protein n=3 Tax=Ellagibacter isourolithinifaciens TaxID=2137581 RepID=UPI003FD86465